MTLAVDLVLAGLLCAAVLHRGGVEPRVLIAAFILSSVTGPSLHGIDRIAVLSIIDAGIVLGMAGIWASTVSMTAYSIGLVGMVKCGLRLAYATNPHMDHLAYAAAINCGFAVQVLIAGGFADALGRWLDGVLRRFLPHRYSLLRNGVT